MGKCRGGLEPPPYSYGTGHCMMDLWGKKENERRLERIMQIRSLLHEELVQVLT